MRKKYILRVVLGVAIIGIAMPVLAALYLAHRQSMDSETELANSMVTEVLRRSDEMGRQCFQALQRIDESAQTLDCSDRNLELLRNVDMESTYLQTVGLVVDGRLMCSSFGRHGAGIELGPVDYVSANRIQVRLSTRLGFGDAAGLLVLQKGNIVGAINPAELIDAFVDRKEVALGVYGHSSGMRIASRGAFDPRWSSLLGDATQTVFFDGSHLVSMKRSASFDTVAYVAVPVANLRARLASFTRILVPIALILAGALSYGIIKLARQRASLPAELRLALKRREFEVHYQPVVDLQSRRIVGIEALLRWVNKDGPPLRPDLFIPVAEECGLISKITNYVIARVAEDMSGLLSDFPECHVSINLSASDLHSDAIVATLRNLVQALGVPADKIMIEATEHSLLDPQRARRVVSDIRKLGIRVAIDDFGTGYSSLSQLTALQSDYLKIDKVFIDAIGTDSPTSEVALHIIRIAESLGLKVIGEGVETEVQASFLHEHGVQFAQGWLFHKAMPVDALRAVLRAQITTSVSSA